MRFVAQFLRVSWRDVAGNVKFEIVKWLWGLGGTAMLSAAFHFICALPWWAYPLIFLVLFPILLMFMGLCRQIATLANNPWEVKLLKTYVPSKEEFVESGAEIACNLELKNLSSRTISGIKIRISAIEMPAGLEAPQSMNVELPTMEEGRERVLLPGESMTFTLFSRLTRAQAFGKKAVLARAIGTWGGMHIFLLGKKRKIVIEVIAHDTPLLNQVYKVGFLPDYQFVW